MQKNGLYPPLALRAYHRLVMGGLKVVPSEVLLIEVYRLGRANPPQGMG